MSRNTAARYHPVRGLERGLAILRALSKAGQGTSAQLAEATRLPRPTVHRLLETLRRAGYVTRAGLRDAYTLTLLIRSLADGYKDEDWITEISHPVLSDLCDEVVWPTDIATYDDGAMVIRATTHGRSPLSIIRATAGWRAPMLTTATGRAYLAFCPDSERTAILETLAKMPGPDSDVAPRPSEVLRELSITRKRGYGLRIKGVLPKISTVAVPLLVDERVLACLNLNWITSAMDAETAVKRYVPALRKAASRIESEYVRSRGSARPLGERAAKKE
jgi:IclR family transcriptional regulator, mhp operon transcriptional activator